MTVSAADIAPKAFRSLVAEGGEHQDVEDDLQVRGGSCLRKAVIVADCCSLITVHVRFVALSDLSGTAINK